MSESDDLVPSDLSERIFKARVGGLTEQATAKKFGVPVREVRQGGRAARAAHRCWNAAA